MHTIFDSRGECCLAASGRERVVVPPFLLRLPNWCPVMIVCYHSVVTRHHSLHAVLTLSPRTRMDPPVLQLALHPFNLLCGHWHCSASHLRAACPFDMIHHRMQAVTKASLVMAIVLLGCVPTVMCGAVAARNVVIYNAFHPYAQIQGPEKTGTLMGKQWPWALRFICICRPVGP